jgi:hypothetical protein
MGPGQEKVVQRVCKDSPSIFSSIGRTHELKKTLKVATVLAVTRVLLDNWFVKSGKMGYLDR